MDLQRIAGHSSSFKEEIKDKSKTVSEEFTAEMFSTKIPPEGIKAKVHKKTTFEEYRKKIGAIINECFKGQPFPKEQECTLYLTHYILPARIYLGNNEYYVPNKATYSSQSTMDNDYSLEANERAVDMEFKLADKEKPDACYTVCHKIYEFLEKNPLDRSQVLKIIMNAKGIRYFDGVRKIKS